MSESILENSDLFLATSKILNCVVSLQKLSNQQQINENEEETIKYVGRLMGRIEWDSPLYKKEGCEDVVSEATQLRFDYLKSLSELKSYDERKSLWILYEKMQTLPQELTKEEASKLEKLLYELGDRSFNTHFKH